MTMIETMQSRYIEFCIAFYFTCSGLVFIVHPATLANPVYAPWKNLTAPEWGASMLFVSLLHFAALWLNGSDQLVSRGIRSVACFLHLLICFIFAKNFYLIGAYWGIMLFGILLPLLLLPVAYRVVSTTVWVARGEVDRHAHK